MKDSTFKFYIFNINRIVRNNVVRYNEVVTKNGLFCVKTSKRLMNV